MKYTHLILNFVASSDVSPLLKRIQAKNSSAKILYIDYHRMTDAEAKELTKIDRTIKIDVILHGNGSDKVSGTNTTGKAVFWNYKEFSKIIVDLLGALKIDPEQFDAKAANPTLSLITCFAAISVAGKIHFELAKNGIFLNMHTRKSAVSICPLTGKKLTSLLALSNKIHLYSEKYQQTKNPEERKQYLTTINQTIHKKTHKQAHSKITLTWEGEKIQAAYDAYALKEYRKTGKMPEPLQKKDFDTLEKLYETLSDSKSSLLTETARAKEEKIEELASSIKEIWGKLDEEYKSINGLFSLFSSKKENIKTEILSIYSIYCALENRETPPTTYLAKHTEFYKQALVLLADADKSPCFQ